jgi:hypothetical protein
MFKNTIKGIKNDLSIAKKDMTVTKAKIENKVLNWCIKKMQKDIISASVKIANNRKYLSK